MGMRLTAVENSDVAYIKDASDDDALYDDASIVPLGEGEGAV